MKTNRLQRAFVAISALISMGFAANAVAAGLPACPASISGPSLITACGCAITKSGNWAVNTDLAGNASQDCIDISAAKVNLRTNGHILTGNGGTGVGINILKSAASANVQLADPANPGTPGMVTGFATGIEVQGSGAILNNFDVSGNHGDDLQIKGATNCAVMNFFADSSATGNGVTINGESGCQIDAFTVSGNAGVGVALINAKSTTVENFAADNTMTGTGNTGGGISLTSSSSNTIANFGADNNGGTNVALTNSSKNSIFFFDATGSGSSGIVLSGSSANSIFDFIASDNAVYGLWLVASSSNSVRTGLTLGNLQTGVYLGCAVAGPTGTACSPTVKPSTKNIVTAIVTGNDTVTPQAQAYGVAVDLGDLENNLSGITATIGDSTDDLFDGNLVKCGTNKWFANAGIMVNQVCTEP